MSPRFRPLFAAFVALAGSAIAVGCNSKADDVCENVSACEQGGSTELTKSCQNEAKTLELTASAGGCGDAFDDYYACANSSFTCTGATATFPGCDGQRAALDDCLTKSAAKNACGELSAKTAKCQSVDAGVNLAPSAACSAKRECAARCYLDATTDPCAPKPNELTAAAACTDSCPP